MSEYPLAPSRRGLLAAVLAAGVVLSGCDLDDVVATTPPPEDPDADRVARVLARTVALQSLLGLVTAAHPDLLGTLEPFSRMHSDHVALLAGAGSASPAPSPQPSRVPGGAGRALERVRLEEGLHAAWLRTVAIEASSGRFARVLACMGAGVDQHLAGAASDCHRHGGTVSAVDALQTVLALEHAAVELYGLLGGQTSQTADPARHGLITARFAVHRERRDDVVAALRRRDAVPVPAAPAYTWPPTRDAGAGRCRRTGPRTAVHGRLRPPRDRQRDGPAGLGCRGTGRERPGRARLGRAAGVVPRGRRALNPASLGPARACGGPEMPKARSLDSLGKSRDLPQGAEPYGPWWAGQQQPQWSSTWVEDHFTDMSVQQAGDLGNDFWLAGSCSA